MNSYDRTFMGITIQGEYNHGHSYLDQRPLEELTAYFQAAFDKGILAIAWKQYTPYFNDGDPCHFSVGDFAFTSNPRVASAWLDDDSGDEDDKYGYDGELIPNYTPTDFYSYEKPSGDEHPDGFLPRDIDLPIGGYFEQALNQTFGDHTTVVVTPEKVVQFEYDHE